MTALTTPVIYPTENDPYYEIAGKRLIRVTGALQCIPRHNLFAWSAKMAATRAVETWQKFQDGVIDDATFTDLFTVERLMKAPFEYRDFKGDIGTVAHTVAYNWALGMRVNALDWPDYIASIVADEQRRGEHKGEPFSATVEDCLPYCDAAIDFCELTQPTFEAIGLETIGVNFTDEYAGRGDAFGCRFEASKQDKDDPTGREVLDFIKAHGDGKSITVTGDWKTSNNQSDEWRYQLAAYSRFEHLVLADGSLHPVPQGEATCNFWIKPKDSGERSRIVPQPCTDREFETFLAARDLYELHSNPTSRVRLSRAKIKQSPTDVRDCPFG